MIMKKRLFIMSLAFVMCLSVSFSYSFAGGLTFTDVKKSDWFYTDVKLAVETGLVNGKSATKYAPNDNLTYSEAVKLAACMNQKYFKGSVSLKNGSPWYQSYVDYCKVNNIIKQDYPWYSTVTRAGYIEIFAHALPDSALAAINAIDDGAIPDIPMTHKNAPAIYKLYRAGIIQGVDSAHNCNPNSKITRSEIASILTRMMYPDTRIKFTISSKPSGKLIVVQPEDQKVAEGQNATFKLTAKGEGLTYQWQQDKGSFSFGSLPSDNNIPNFAKDFSNLKNKGFNTAQLDSSVPIVPDLKDSIKFAGLWDNINWNLPFLVPKFKSNWVNISDSADVKGSNSNSLTVKAKLKLFKSGGYRCIVKDKNGKQEISKEVALVSKSPGIKIIKQPESKKAKKGDWVNFSVSAKGSSVLYYQWKDASTKKDLENSADMTGVSTPNLKVKAQALNPLFPLISAQKYYCEISDPYGVTVTSNPAKITTIDLKIIKQPSSFSIPSNNHKFSLSVLAVGDSKIEYQWRMVTINGDKILNDGPNYQGTKTDTLTAYEPGTYFCRVKGSLGQEIFSNNATVHVESNIGKPINVITPPHDTKATRGKFANFSIDFNSLGEAKIQWQKKGSSGWYNLANGDTYSGVNERNFKVKVEGETMYDEYRCCVDTSNPSYTYTSPPVKIKQIFSVTPKSAQIKVLNKSQAYSLLLNVSGDGLNYEWGISPDNFNIDPSYSITETKGSKINISMLNCALNNISFMQYQEYTNSVYWPSKPDPMSCYCRISDTNGNTMVVGPFTSNFDEWDAP